MKTVAIVGSSGITAKQLIKILEKHNKVKIKYIITSSISYKDKEILGEYNYLSDTFILSYNDKKIFTVLNKNNIDLIFLCLPHKVSMQFLSELYYTWGLEHLPNIIDLSADFRLKDVKLYEYYYESKHILPELINYFVYGLPDISLEVKENIKSSKFVANPGCYPTSVILGLAPIIKEVEEIIIDAKSGYSGGGKKLIEEYESYGGNNTYPYKAYGEHRHIPEIKQQLTQIAQKEINFLFTPYVIPQYQGMLTTIYVKLKDKKENLYQEYINYYKDSKFIRILTTLPQTRKIINTNFCDIGFAEEKNSSWIKIFVAIDNLIKGAAGQAIQNMNLMFGYDEDESLL